MHKTQTAVTDASVLSAAGHAAGSQKIRLFYAGDMDFARPQFASEAPQLELVALAESTIRDARAKNTAPPVDVAFIDCSSPGVNAPWLLDELRRAFPLLPVVVAVDPGREDAAREAVELKADDYTVKSPRWLARLPVRLGIVIRRHRALAEANAVHAQEQRLRLIIESAPVCLARLGRDGTVLAINTAGRALLGAELPSAVLKKSFLSFVEAGHHDALRDFLQRVCEGNAGSTEFSTVGAPDSNRIVEASAIPLPPVGDKAETALVVLKDVTTRRRLEQHVETIVPAAAKAANAAELETRLAEMELTSRQLTEERDRLAQAIEDGNATVDALARRLEQRGLELNSVIAERDDLSRRVETAERELTKLEARIDKEQTELEQLRAEHDRALHAAADGTANAGALAQRLDVRDSELDAIKAERDDLSRRVEAAEAAVRTSEAQLGKDRVALQRLTLERDHLLNTIRDIQPAVAALKQELEKRRVECIRLTSERDTLQQTLEETQSRHDHDLGLAVAAREAAESRLREIEAHAGEKQAIEQQYQELAAQVGEWKTECQRLEAERNALEAAHQREADARAVHERAVEQKHEELEAALAARGATEARLREAEEQLIQKQALQAQRDELEVQVRDWKSACERLEAERDALDAARSREADARLAQERAVQQKHDELETVLASRIVIEARLREVEAQALQKDALQRQHDDLTRQLRDAEAESARLQTEREVFETARRQEQQQHAQELQAVRQQHDRITAQLHDSEGVCRRLETERAALQTVMADLRSQASVERDAYQLLELQLQDVDAARFEAVTERDRLKNILADAFARFHNQTAAAQPAKEIS